MNWKSIFATALVTGLVTLATGMLLFWWQTKEPELTYNSVRSIPFDDASNKLFIQQVEVQNSGEKRADNVVLVMGFKNETILKSQFSIPDTLPHKKEVSKDSLRLQIGNLNPGERASVSVLLESTTSTPGGAEISLRADDITGRQLGSDESNKKLLLLIAVAAAYAGIVAAVLFTKRGRLLLPILMNRVAFGGSISGALSTSQRNVIASHLALYGYPERAKESLDSPSHREYWVEADLLAAEAMCGDEKFKNDMVEVLKAIARQPLIAPRSKAITLYNISRILTVLNASKNEVSSYLDQAKEADRSEIEERLEWDPLFTSNAGESNE